MAIVVKLGPAFLFAPLYPFRETIIGGTLLGARLSFIIATAMIGPELGVISESLNSVVVLLAVVTCTLYSMQFCWIAPSLS